MRDASFVTRLRLTGVDAAHDAALARKALQDCEVLHMVLDEHPGETRAYYDRVVELVGTPMDAAEDYVDGQPTGDRWSEIRYNSDVPDDVAFRHSKNAQPLHTDASYVSSPPQVMWFYCDNAAPSGGETVFVSGRSLVAELAESRPELFDRLINQVVTYEKAGDARTRPIIEIDDHEAVDLNFNYYCADAQQGTDGLSLNETFFRYLQQDLPRELVADIGLRPGDAVAWWDDRVLHGRNAFEAVQTGDRSIWKTGLYMEPSA
ncbi:MAG: TauD/TfdA family dioxygenase [Actinomycetota bacterium]